MATMKIKSMFVLALLIALAVSRLAIAAGQVATMDAAPTLVGSAANEPACTSVLDFHHYLVTDANGPSDCVAGSAPVGGGSPGIRCDTICNKATGTWVH